MYRLITVLFAVAVSLLAVQPASADKPGPPPSEISFDDTAGCGFLVHFVGTHVSANSGSNLGGSVQGVLSNPASGRSVRINTGGNFRETSNPDGTLTVEFNGRAIWIFDANDPHAQGIYVLFGHQVATFDNSKPVPLTSLQHNGGESQNYCLALA